MGKRVRIGADALTRPLQRTPDTFGSETSRVGRGEAGIGQADGASTKLLTAQLLEFDLYGARCRIARTAGARPQSTWPPEWVYWVVVVMHKDGYSPAYSRQTGRSEGCQRVAYLVLD